MLSSVVMTFIGKKIIVLCTFVICIELMLLLFIKFFSNVLGKWVEYYNESTNLYRDCFIKFPFSV